MDSTAQAPDREAPPRITVVVLAFNSERFIAGCLDALAQARDVELEIICVDNASTDASHEVAKKHPAKPRAIRSEKNTGCAGGNNVGWRAGSAPCVVFINPDCRVLPETLRNLVRPLITDERVGATGARLLYPNTRTIQHAGGILHPNAMSEHIGMGKPDGPEYDADREVDFVTGALMAMRRADLERMGGFDEEIFPAYYEETDLLARLQLAGKQVLYVGSARAYHWESAGLTKGSARFVRTSYRSRMFFLIKNYTAVELAVRFLPFELRWFFGPYAKGFRLQVIRSYFSGAAFALRCIGRFSRRRR